MKIAKYLTTESKNVTDLGLFILRVVAALVLLKGHGLAKLDVIISGQEIQFMDPIGIGAVPSFLLATFAEGICAILLVIGLFSRFSTLVLSGNFLVIFIFHAFMVKDGFDVLELRYFYLATFIALTFTGPGKFSLDYMLFNVRK